MISDQSKEIFVGDCISMHEINRRVRSNSSSTCGDSIDTMSQPKENSNNYVSDLRPENVAGERQ